MIARFINRLDGAGLLHDSSFDDEDIVDSIWLALQIGVVDKPKPANNEGSIRFDDIQELKPENHSITEVLDIYPDY